MSKSKENWRNFNIVEDLAGMEDINGEIDPSQQMQIYNQQGILIGTSIDDLAPGIYILRQGNKSKKCFCGFGKMI